MANACVSCSSVRFRSYLCWLLIYVLPVIRGGHFRGGYISWRTLPSNETNATMVTINIQQTYWWSYRLVPCVAAPIGGPGSLVCRTSNCSNYVSYMANVSAPCIAFDVGLDASTAQSVTPVTLQAGSRLVIGYFSSAWLPLVNSNSVAFSLGILIDLNVRYDTGRINSSPTSTMAALVTVLPNTRQILRIPMSDVDSDVVKCRWASGTYMIDSSTIDECGGICGNLPGAQLYSSSNTDNECMLVFTTTLPGYYVVALQIEDFMPSAPNGSALSSIPLQFLVQAINTTCNQPNITGQLTNGAFIAVQVNKTFSTTIIVEAGCNATNITRFLTIVSPSNNVTTSRVLALDSMTYSMNFTWTPVDNQIGSTQLFCTVAIDANNLQSNQFCLNFVVPAITTSTSTTTGATITSTNTDSITITIHRTVDLTWILGLGIPLALLAGILGSCIACRCYDSLCWKKLRERCRPKKDSTNQRYRSSEADQSSILSQQASRQYRRQHINEDPSVPSRHSSYDDLNPPLPLLPTRTRSMGATRTSFLSVYSNSFLTSIETPSPCSPLPNSFDAFHPSDRSSILVNNYLEQSKRQSILV